MWSMQQHRSVSSATRHVVCEEEGVTTIWGHTDKLVDTTAVRHANLHAVYLVHVYTVVTAL